MRLGWVANSLSYHGVQYDAETDGTFIVPREVYLELQDQGAVVFLVSQSGTADPGDEVQSDPPLILPTPITFGERIPPYVLGASPAERAAGPIPPPESALVTVDGVAFVTVTIPAR